MSAISISRPKQARSVAPATVLPTALLLRLFGLHVKLTVVLDGKAVGKIGVEEVKVFEVEPGEHRLRMRLVLLRRSKELRSFLAANEERRFLCGTNGIGWPTLREASPNDAAGVPRTTTGG